MKQFKVASNLDDDTLAFVRACVCAYRRIESIGPDSGRPFHFCALLGFIDSIIDDINLDALSDSAAVLIPFVEED